MYVSTSFRPLTPQELQFRRHVIRDAIICLGWIKYFSICCYIGLFFLIKAYSEGGFATMLKLMILLIIPLQTVSATLLIIGAIESKEFILQLAVWLCIAIATYNTILGVLGTVYFIRIGHEIMHFVIAMFFLLLSLSICCVLCHDMIVLLAFLKILQNPPSTPMEPELLMITYNPSQTPTQQNQQQQQQQTQSQA